MGLEKSQEHNAFFRCLSRLIAPSQGLAFLERIRFCEVWSCEV